MHGKILTVIILVSLCYSIQTDFSNIIQKTASVLPLSGSWKAKNSNGSIKVEAQVPGSIYTDLWRNHVIGDPYFRNNNELYRWIGRENWTFSNVFKVECHLLQKKRIILLAHGLDTVSTIFLNGKLIGTSNNMFVRYTFDIKSLLEAKNSMQVIFESPVSYALKAHRKQLQHYVIPPTCPPPVQRGECHVNYIRKAQSSFSWDWGPSFPTQGIWKPLEIIGFDSLLISDVTVATQKTQSGWNLDVTVFVETATTEGLSGAFTIYLDDRALLHSQVNVTLEENFAANQTFKLKVPKDFVVKPWWPNGLGEPVLYKLTVSFSDTHEIVNKTIRIGFRTLELVQQPIKNSTGLSFFFRVNGVPFFAKGSNWIPADSFQERVTPEVMRGLLGSARDAHMNMLRVWGGGVYEADAFYDLADEMGLFIWQDLMFACALYPVDSGFLDTVTTEVTQQVRRLQHHPSLLLWAGNNENEQSIAGRWWPAVKEHLEQYTSDYIRLYIETVALLVKQEDPTRPFLPSSPSNGPETARQGWIARDPQDVLYGDIHFYTYTGDEWSPRTYPTPRFVSEYGFQSYPCFETLANVSLPSDWIYPFTDFMGHRQHHMFGDAQISRMIGKHFTLPSKNCGLRGFKDMLYLSQIVQAVAIKTQTEKYRRNRNELVDGEGATMGALYWQLNDIWQAPSWSSIGYGGRWKMLHYYAKNFFHPILVSPFEDEGHLVVYVVSDVRTPLHNITLTVQIYSWTSLQPLFLQKKSFDQPADFSRKIYEYPTSDLLHKAGCASRQTCFLHFRLTSAEGRPLGADNLLFWAPFQGLVVPHITVNVTGPFSSQAANETFELRFTTDQVAPFVWLEGVSGTFSDNGFTLISKTHSVLFYADAPLSATSLRDKLRIRSLIDVCT